MIKGFTTSRFDAKGAQSANIKVNGNSANPFQEGKTFKMATESPFGLATSTDGNRTFALVYLINEDGQEVELWLNMLTKTVTNGEDKTVTASEYKFNQDFTAKVLGKDNASDWWKAFADLVGDKELICHRQSVWVDNKRFIIIGFDLK